MWITSARFGWCKCRRLYFFKKNGVLFSNCNLMHGFTSIADRLWIYCGANWIARGKKPAAREQEKKKKRKEKRITKKAIITLSFRLTIVTYILININSAHALTRRATCSAATVNLFTQNINCERISANFENNIFRVMSAFYRR